MATKKLALVSTLDLQAEIERRRRALPKQRAERDRLVKQLEKLEANIAELEGSVRVGGGKRAAAIENSQSLADALVAVIKEHKTISVKDAVDAVLDRGYKTRSKIFRTIVAQSLSRDKRFKTVERGVYKLA